MKQLDTSRRAPLPTSRHHPRRERSVLAILRSLRPRRSLRRGEAERVAERQADLLLRMAGITKPPVPIEVITELPRLQVVAALGLPSPALTQWIHGRWLVSVAVQDHPYAQRLAVARELKRILDHPFQRPANARRPAQDFDIDRLGDYFALCLLAPRDLVRKEWRSGAQRLSPLSRRFQLSPRVMQIRLWQIGLVSGRPAHLNQRRGHTPPTSGDRL